MFKERTPFHRYGQRGASAILVAMMLAAVSFVVLYYMRLDTDRTIQFNYRMRAGGEMRRANQMALETVSQMLVSDAVRVPLPGNREYAKGASTASRERQDSQELLTQWLVSSSVPADQVALVNDKYKRTLRFTSCQARSLKGGEIDQIYKARDIKSCDKKMYTDVVLREVALTQHLPGYFTMDTKVAADEQKRGRVVTKTGDGYEIKGLVRRNLVVDTYTTFENENKIAFGAVGSKKGSKKAGGSGATGSGASAAKYGTTALVNSAIMTVTSDVDSHKCRWLDKTWQEKVVFTPPTAEGGQDAPKIAYVSQTKSHPGGGTNCAYSPQGAMTGYRGGVHQKQGVVSGWGVNVCNYGTMFFIEKPDSPNCFLNLVPLRGAGNFVGGCFAPGTAISMADGSTRKIEDIGAGDMVLNPVTGKAQAVRSVRRGYESKPLIEIGYGDKKVAVTDNHPFVVEEGSGKGLRQARHLKAGDRVLGADGSWQVVSHYQILPEEPYQWVHNLALESADGAIDEHVVLANGVLTGDHFLQTQLEARIFAETGRKVKAAEAALPYLSQFNPNLAQ